MSKTRASSGQIKQNLVFQGDVGITIPTGSTAQRNPTPQPGEIRFNTDLNVFEGYTGSAWGSIGPYPFATVDYFTGGPGKYFPQFTSVGGYPAGWFAGGGGASGDARNARGFSSGLGGIGSGGNGAPATTGGTAQSGGANTGGGGGGAAGNGYVGSVIAPGSGGSGVVIVRYRYD